MKEKIKIYTRPMKAQKAGNNDSGSRRKKLMRFFGASSLAIIMGAGVLCGTILAPLATHTNTSAGDDPSLTAQEQLLAGTLELDPENDPIIATTDWGLDIKFHAEWGSFEIVSSNTLKGYCYFSMGKYNNVDVNWVIVGRSTDVAQSFYCAGQYTSLGKQYTNYTYSNYMSLTTTNATYYKNNQYEASSDAGSVILSAGNNGLIYDFKNILFGNSVANAEISSGCVLCVSEKTIGSSSFNTNTGSNNYKGSTLQTSMSNLYSTNLGFTEAQKSAIKPQDLYTLYTSNTTIREQYMFPLAGRSSSEGFYLHTYLGYSNYNIGTNYWLRSGWADGSAHAYCVHYDGYVGLNYNGQSVATSFGMRPAFVMQL